MGGCSSTQTRALCKKTPRAPQPADFPEDANRSRAAAAACGDRRGSGRAALPPLCALPTLRTQLRSRLAPRGRAAPLPPAVLLPPSGSSARFGRSVPHSCTSGSADVANGSLRHGWAESRWAAAVPYGPFSLSTRRVSITRVPGTAERLRAAEEHRGSPPAPGPGSGGCERTALPCRESRAGSQHRTARERAGPRQLPSRQPHGFSS